MAGKKKRDCNLNPQKQWGGKRENGGFPAKWRSGNSKPIRIPESLHEAVLAYAHKLDEVQQPDAAPSKPQGMIQLNATDKPLTSEDIRQMRLTLEAVRLTLEQWRWELVKHNAESLRWKKANELFNALEAQLGGQL